MIRKASNEHVYAGVISHLRSQNVSKMEALCGPLTWYVGDGEGDEYREAGATNVIESGGLCRSRNAILDDAFAKGLTALELSDDLRKLEVATDPKHKHEVPFAEVVDMMLAAMASTGAHLGGVAPVPNAFYFNPKKPIHTQAFIVGDLIAVKPTPLRFDEDLRLKEDYDYTIQHVVRYGVVARCNSVMAHFAHRTNSGGACHYRTSEVEQQTIAQLRWKWPGFIRDNPRRPDEILLNLKPSAR